MVPIGMMTDDIFLAGYGMAQAIPGPLFTLLAYLGAVAAPIGASTGLWSLLALIFVFLPGMLFAVAGVPLWQYLRRHPSAQGALAGINASVVGILAAALYDPIWKTAVLGRADILIAIISFFMLERWKGPPIVMVIFCLMASVGFSFFYQR